MLKPFRYGQSRELVRTPIFGVHEHEAEHPRTGSVRPYVTLDAPDWVNVVALTPAGEVVECHVVSSELADPDLERKLVARIRMFRFEARDVETMTATKPIEFFPA